MDEDELISQIPGIPYPETEDTIVNNRYDRGIDWHTQYIENFPTVADTHALYDSLLHKLYSDKRWDVAVGSVDPDIDVSPILTEILNSGQPMSEAYIMVGDQGDIGRYKGGSSDEEDRAYFRPDQEWSPEMNRMPVDTIYVTDPNVEGWGGYPMGVEDLLAESAHLWQFSGKDLEGNPQVSTLEDLAVFRDSLTLQANLQANEFGSEVYNMPGFVENQAHYEFEPMLDDAYYRYIWNLKNKNKDITNE